MSNDRVNQLSAPQSGSRIAEFERIVAQSQSIETSAIALRDGGNMFTGSYNLWLTYRADRPGVNIFSYPGGQKFVSSVGAGLADLLSPPRRLVLKSRITARGTNCPIDGETLRRLAIDAWYEAAKLPSPNQAEMNELLSITDNLQLTRTGLVEFIDRWDGSGASSRAIMSGTACPTFDDLRWFIETTKDTEKKKNAYLALAWLGRRTQDAVVAEFMMERVRHEKNKHILEELLSAIQYVGTVADSRNAIELISDKSSNVRSGAMSALGSCHDEKARVALMSALQNEHDEGVLICACRAIGRTGTLDAIPILIELLDRSNSFKKLKPELRSAVLDALSRIDAEGNIHVFVSTLETDSSPDVKWQCLQVLREHGTEAQIGAVIAQLRKLVAKKNRKAFRRLGGDGIDERTELTLGMDFLRRFNTPEISSFYNWLSTKRDSLLESERQYIKESGLPLNI